MQCLSYLLPRLPTDSEKESRRPNCCLWLPPPPIAIPPEDDADIDIGGVAVAVAGIGRAAAAAAAAAPSSPSAMALVSPLESMIQPTCISTGGLELWRVLRLRGSS